MPHIASVEVVCLLYLILNIFCKLVTEKIRQLYVVFSIDMQYILYRRTM